MGLLEIQLTASKEQSLTVYAASSALGHSHVAGIGACGINSMSFINRLCMELSGARRPEVGGNKKRGIHQ